MSHLRPPIYDFDRIKPVTMTVIALYDVEELNLAAIFAFLPVTTQNLSAQLNIQKKQGKIRLPAELNQPGEILSMRYDNQVRGIMRSEKAKSFSHSIIIDIGTSDRIISVKLSRKLEFTGPTSIAIAREAADSILGKIKQCQDDLQFLQTHQEYCMMLKEKFINAEATPEDEIGQRIWNIFTEKTYGYTHEHLDDFLTFMINFNLNLYTGSLKLDKFECEMANIQFNLGYPINQLAFVKVMNESPFRCTFNNYKTASSVAVYYDYTKYDRNTGQAKHAKHTISVNRSGHVRHSGPNLESMKAVYYAFMQRVIQCFDQIRSVENKKKQLRVDGPCKVLSIEEWRDFIRQEEQLRQKVIASEVPIATGEPVVSASPPESPTANMQAEIDNNVIVIGNYEPIADETKTMETFSFDYAPLTLQ